MPTTFNIHWGEVDDLTVTDSSGASEKTGGSGGSFDASARAKDRFDGLSTVIAKVTYGVAGDMAFGIHAQSTAYVQGGVTVASLLGCWSIEGGNCVIRESNTSRFSGVVAINDILEIHIIMTSGTASLVYKQNGTTRHTSAITSTTIKSWAPWRWVTTHSGAGSKWSAATLDGESAEHYDPASSSNNLVADTTLMFLTLDPFEMEVMIPASQFEEVVCPPTARAFVM